jgi:hypothetical protein
MPTSISATAHMAHASTVLLCDVFGDQLISRDIWPPRSPDLTHPDFFCGEQCKVLSAKTILVVSVI